MRYATSLAVGETEHQQAISNTEDTHLISIENHRIMELFVAAISKSHGKSPTEFLAACADLSPGG
jgi:hypothetical protein